METLNPHVTPETSLPPNEQFRVLVTGTRGDLTQGQRVTITRTIDQILRAFGVPWTRCLFILGDCPTGVDKYAWSLAYAMYADVMIHTAEWDRLGRSAGPARNQKMVDAHPHIAVAFPMGASRGTRDCARRCVRAGVLTHMVELSTDSPAPSPDAPRPFDPAFPGAPA